MSVSLDKQSWLMQVMCMNYNLWKRKIIQGLQDIGIELRVMVCQWWSVNGGLLTVVC